jgi:hypothetical protein
VGDPFRNQRERLKTEETGLLEILGSNPTFSAAKKHAYCAIPLVKLK